MYHHYPTIHASISPTTNLGKHLSDLSENSFVFIDERNSIIIMNVNILKEERLIRYRAEKFYGVLAATKSKFSFQ